MIIAMVYVVLSAFTGHFCETTVASTRAIITMTFGVRETVIQLFLAGFLLVLVVVHILVNIKEKIISYYACN